MLIGSITVFSLPNTFSCWLVKSLIQFFLQIIFLQVLHIRSSGVLKPCPTLLASARFHRKEMSLPKSWELETLKKLTIAPTETSLQDSWIHNGFTNPDLYLRLSITQPTVTHPTSAMDNHSCREISSNWQNELYDHPNTTETLPIPRLSFKGERSQGLLLSSSLIKRSCGGPSLFSQPPLWGITLEGNEEGQEYYPGLKGM